MSDEQDEEDYKANFLYEYEEGSIEEAGYEFANALTEPYRQIWWTVLLERIREPKP